MIRGPTTYFCSMDFIVKTERLVLFEWNESHAEVLFDLNSDPDVIRYTGDPPFESIEDARQLILNYDQYKSNGYGRWLCALRETGEIVGWCGLKLNNENDDQFIDLGYRFFKKHWGKGFATESAYASLKVGFEKLGMNFIIARAVQENEASISVMKKLGMTRFKEVQCHGLPAEYYSLGREEFEAFFAKNPPITALQFPE